MRGFEKKFILLLGIWMLTSTALVTFAVWKDPVQRAGIKMAWGLIILWVLLGGALMYKYQNAVKGWIQKIPLKWQVKFVLFSTCLILIEEAITTGMTNLAPLFGVKLGQAYITASSNYWDVIFYHSVIVIAPMFIGWAVLLSYFAFTPFEIFLLFGLTGTLAEAGYGGPNALGAFAFWTFIYGLMVYLPAEVCVPPGRAAKRPGWWLYPLAIIFPFLFIPLTAWVPHLVDPNHPKIDF